jgi:hypothetical protein
VVVKGRPRPERSGVPNRLLYTGTISVHALRRTVRAARGSVCRLMKSAPRGLATGKMTIIGDKIA